MKIRDMETNSDLTVVGAIFALIIQIGVYLKSEYNGHLLNAQLFQAKKTVVELYEEKETAYEMVASLNKYADDSDAILSDVERNYKLLKDLLSSR